jgi:hypothetical protein
MIEGVRNELGIFLKPVIIDGNEEEVEVTNADFKSTTPSVPYQNIQHT